MHGGVGGGGGLGGGGEGDGGGGGLGDGGGGGLGEGGSGGLGGTRRSHVPFIKLAEAATQPVGSKVPTAPVHAAAWSILEPPSTVALTAEAMPVGSYAVKSNFSISPSVLPAMSATIAPMASAATFSANPCAKSDTALFTAFLMAAFIAAFVNPLTTCFLKPEMAFLAAVLKVLRVAELKYCVPPAPAAPKEPINAAVEATATPTSNACCATFAVHVAALREHAAMPHWTIQPGQMDWQAVSWHLKPCLGAG